MDNNIIPKEQIKNSGTTDFKNINIYDNDLLTKDNRRLINKNMFNKGSHITAMKKYLMSKNYLILNDYREKSNLSQFVDLIAINEKGMLFIYWTQNRYKSEYLKPRMKHINALRKLLKDNQLVLIVNKVDELIDYLENGTIYNEEYFA